MVVARKLSDREEPVKRLLRKLKAFKHSNEGKIRGGRAFRNTAK